MPRLGAGRLRGSYSFLSHQSTIYIYKLRNYRFRILYCPLIYCLMKHTIVEIYRGRDLDHNADTNLWQKWPTWHQRGTRMKATVFLGGGRITGALLAGLRLAHYRRPILIYDRNPSKLRRLKKLYGVGVEQDLHRAVAQARLLIIAVQPVSVADLLREVGDIGRPLAAVSLAAGVPLANLRRYLARRFRGREPCPALFAVAAEV